MEVEFQKVNSNKYIVKNVDKIVDNVKNYTQELSEGLNYENNINDQLIDSLVSRRLSAIFMKRFDSFKNKDMNVSNYLLECKIDDRSLITTVAVLDIGKDKKILNGVLYR